MSCRDQNPTPLATGHGCIANDDASARSGTFDPMERSVLGQVTVHLKFSGGAQ